MVTSSVPFGKIFKSACGGDPEECLALQGEEMLVLEFDLGGLGRGELIKARGEDQNPVAATEVAQLRRPGPFLVT